MQMLHAIQVNVVQVLQVVQVNAVQMMHVVQVSLVQLIQAIPALTPLLPYIFVVVSTLATLGLFAGVSARLGKLRKSVSRGEESLQAEAAQLTNTINDLKRRIAKLEAAEDYSSAGQEPGLLLSNAARGRVFKLHRSGEPSGQIAQKLRLPKGEVDLLIKVQREVMRPYENSSTTTPERAQKG